MRLSSYCSPSYVHGTRTAWALIVMPRSRSRSIESSICSRMSRSATAPVSCRMRSASVDLPWSMCATIEKLRIRDCSTAQSWQAAGARAARRLGGSRAAAPAHEREHIVELLDAHRARGHDVHADGRGEARAERHELHDDEFAGEGVEPAPDGVGGAGRERSRDGDAHERAHEL